MNVPERKSPQEVRKKVQNGEALLICGYDDDEKYAKNHLEGAMSLTEFQNRLPSLNKDQELIFYCA
jgi:rhodanese-related sulfurtransferase